MRDTGKLLQLLQFNGGTFPTGGFSQSWGLETYVTEGIVRDMESFRRFLESFLMSSIGKCEGPIICMAYMLMRQLKAGGTADALRELEQISNAVKVTRESREAGLRMGRAFGRIVQPMLDGKDLGVLREVFGTMGISYPVIYGCVCQVLEIDLKDALAAYIFSTANTLTQSALKLIPLGNVEAQKALFDEDAFMERVCDVALDTSIEDISNFCPGIDIASLRHEELPVRLYMS